MTRCPYLFLLMMLVIISMLPFSTAVNIGNPNWNITGNWTYNNYFNGTSWTHIMVIDVFHPDSGQFRGYVDDPSLKWLVYGIVAGDNITFQIIRFTGDMSYYTDAAGTISSNSYMSGDAVSPGQVGIWNATKMTGTTSMTAGIMGVVKFFNNDKKFGFIAGDDGKDYFIHETDVMSGVTIKEGDRVSFEVVEGEKGPKAVHLAIYKGFGGGFG